MNVISYIKLEPGCDIEAFTGKAIEMSNLGADMVFVEDCSNDDLSHEHNIRTMINISDKADLSMICGGRAKRLEDIKKYLYSGAKISYLEYDKESNRELFSEAASRFGFEKVALMVDSENDDVINFIKDQKVSVIICKSTSVFDSLKDVVDADFYVFANEDSNISDDASGIILQDFDGDYFEVKNALKGRGLEVNVFESPYEFSSLKTNADGMIPVIVQDYKTDQVLMLAYMNEEAFNLTLKTGKMTYYSRSRDEIWVKGLTSGHYQYLKDMSLDCDFDTILAKVYQVGAACHTGSRSCFFNRVVKKDYTDNNPQEVLRQVYDVILDRKNNPKEGSYTNYLFDKGIDKILKKVGEEATEIVIAAKNPDPQEVKYEMSDFLYHAMVLMAEKGITWDDIAAELLRRE